MLEAEFFGVVVYLLGWGVGLVGESCWLGWLEGHRALSWVRNSVWY